MKTPSLALFHSLYILLIFQILPASPQISRTYYNSPHFYYPMEDRLNDLKAVLKCISRQDDTVFSKSLIDYAKSKHDNINEELLQENINNYAVTDNDKELIFECTRFGKSYNENIKNKEKKINTTLLLLTRNRRYKIYEQFKKKNRRRRRT